MASMQDLLDKNLAPLREDIKTFQESLSAILTKAVSAEKLAAEAHTRIVLLEGELNDCKADVKSLKDYIVRQDTYERRDCLKVFGIPEAEGEVCGDALMALFRELEVLDVDTIKFTKVHRHGRFVRGITRPIMAKFHYYPDLENVFARRERLRGSGKFITRVFAPQVEANRRKLAPVVRAVFDHKDTLPVDQKKAYKIKYVDDRLMINGKTFTVENLSDLPNEVNIKKLFTPETDSHVYFWSSLSPLSNHHRADMMIEGIHYNCVEQYIMYQKATLFKDTVTATRVMKEDEPTKQKQLGKDVHGFRGPMWTQQCQDIVRIGLRAKFTQNQDLRDQLLATGTKVLAEANPNDGFWGVGLRLSDPAIHEEKNWKGKNILGKLLAEIRKDL